MDVVPTRFVSRPGLTARRTSLCKGDRRLLPASHVIKDTDAGGDCLLDMDLAYPGMRLPFGEFGDDVSRLKGALRKYTVIVNDGTKFGETRPDYLCIGCTPHSL